MFVTSIFCSTLCFQLNRPRSDSAGSSSSEEGDSAKPPTAALFKIPVGSEEMDINNQGRMVYLSRNFPFFVAKCRNAVVEKS